MKINQHQSIYNLIINFFLFSILLYFINPIYRDTDHIYFIELVDGLNFFLPKTNWTNYLSIDLVNLLQKLNLPDFFYTTAYITIIAFFISSFIFSNFLAEKLDLKPYLSPFLGFLFIMPWFLTPQFTLTAGSLSIAAHTILLRKNLKLINYIQYFVLIFLSIQIRAEIAITVAILFHFYFFLGIFKDIKKIYPILITFLLVGISYFIRLQPFSTIDDLNFIKIATKYQKDPSFQSILNFGANKDLLKLTENTDLFLNGSKPSINDIKLITSWFLIDQEVLDSTIEFNRKENKINFFQISNLSFFKIKDFIKFHYHYEFIFLSIIILCIVLTSPKSLVNYIILLSYLIHGLILIFMNRYKVLEPHLPLYLSLIFIFIYQLEKKLKHNTILKIFIYFILIFQGFDYSRKIYQQNIISKLVENEIGSLIKNKNIMLFRWSDPDLFRSIFTTIKRNRHYKDFKIIHAPSFYGFPNQDSDQSMFNAFSNHLNLGGEFLVLKISPYHVSLLTTYCKEHYGKEFEISEVKSKKIEAHSYGLFSCK